MLAAKAAVDRIAAGVADKTALWSVDVEEEYREDAGRTGGAPLARAA